MVSGLREYEKLNPQYGIKMSGWRKAGAHK